MSRLCRRKRVKLLNFELLESRRLLIAEGDSFAFSNTFDAAGLLGNVSASIRWGDGTTTPATSVVGGNTSGNLKIKFDYSLDSGGFFSGANLSRRTFLENAANSLISRFTDDLAPIEPGGLMHTSVSIFHPSSGLPTQLEGTLTPLAQDIPVAANEIILYAGSRDLPGDTRGAGTFAIPAASLDRFTAGSQAEVDAILAQFTAFQANVRGRGEAGALLSSPTDFAPSFGSISFDNATEFYFDQPEGILPNQIDFTSVATHELAHALGFGVSDSWKQLARTGTYTGDRANAAFVGTGSVPIVVDHWAQSVVAIQPTLMTPEIKAGEQVLFSPLDFAGMEDLGWELADTNVTVAGEHRFADDGRFDVQVVLRGSVSGELTLPLSTVTVTNVAPTLTVPSTQTVTVGQTLSLTNLGVITDPGSRNPTSQPPSVETFSYTIDWNDGSAVDTGTATIDSHGDRNGGLTQASFDGSHTFTTVGVRQVTVTVTDDDDSTTSKTFTVNVQAVAVPSPTVTISPTGPSGVPDPANLAGTGSQPTSWSRQRSTLRRITISVASPLTTVVASDLVLTNLGVNAPLDTDQVITLRNDQISLSSDRKQILIDLDANQLSDGVYQLTLLPTITGGEPFTLVGNATNKFYVLRGDWDGSGAVSGADFATFAYWFNQSVPTAPAYVDINDSGDISTRDFSGFAGNFGNSITFPTVVASMTAGGEGESLSISKSAGQTCGPEQSVTALVARSETSRSLPDRIPADPTPPANAIARPEILVNESSQSSASQLIPATVVDEFVRTIDASDVAVVFNPPVDGWDRVIELLSQSSI